MMKPDLQKAWEIYAEENGISKDKRTKSYKDFKTQYNDDISEGIGDTVEKITKATGIKKVVEFFTDGEPCDACERRKQKWNSLFRYNKPKELTEEEYFTLDDFFSTYKNSISDGQQRILIVIYNRIFNGKRKYSRCAPCVRGMIEELRKIYIEY